MANLKRGTVYTLRREASRPLSVSFVASWTEKTSDGKKRIRFLFELGKRAAARKGLKTAPKLKLGARYVLERTGGREMPVRLVAQTSEANGARLLVCKRVFRIKFNNVLLKKEMDAP